MKSNPRGVWVSRIPEADAVLRESVLRVTAQDNRTWGFVLARLRTIHGQSPAEQAALLGITVSALTFMSICRLPRDAHREEDLSATAALVAVPVQVLRQLLEEASSNPEVSNHVETGRRKPR